MCFSSDISLHFTIDSSFQSIKLEWKTWIRVGNNATSNATNVEFKAVSSHMNAPCSRVAWPCVSCNVAFSPSLAANLNVG